MEQLFMSAYPASRKRGDRNRQISIARSSGMQSDSPRQSQSSRISTMWGNLRSTDFAPAGLCSVTFEVMAGSLFCAAYKKYRPRPAKPLPANTATADVAADESPTAWLRYKCRKQSNPKTRGTRRPSAMLPRHYVLPRQIPSGVSPLEAADGRQTCCAVC